MLSIFATTLALTAAAAVAATDSIPISITPHDKYSSSIGVLGCHVDTNRIAYFPDYPSCDSACVEVTANKRTVHLLHVDHSGGAYDISYDAWNYLVTGASAKDQPTMGGLVPAEYKRVDMDKCQDIIKTPDKKLPLMATNSMGFYLDCPKGSYIRENSALYNIQNCACTLGFNEVCKLEDAPGINQAVCAHQLGAQNPLSGLPVIDIVYGSNTEAIATQ